MKKGIFKLVALFFICSCCMMSVTYADRPLPWSQWVQELRKEALSQGVRPEVFDEAFRGVKPNPRVRHLDKTQPEKRLTFLEYRKSRIDPYRITLGVREYRKRRNVLDKVGNDFGVDPCVITALWGLESSYGRYLGKFPVIASLATLAYDGRRTAFFRKELLIALHILNGDNVDLEDFKGEWAGASGHPQFLPSSWEKFAVDYDGDGRKNIWTDLNDVFASIANYMAKNGWQPGEPYYVQVKLDENFNRSLIGYDHKQSVAQWLQKGVVLDDRFTPNLQLQASIIEPYGGPPLMIFQNFRCFLRYNNSTYYAGSVGYLARKICQKAGI